MESNNRCHPIAQWKRRCEQSRRSWCGARARWARLGTIRGNWGLGRGRWKIGGGSSRKRIQEGKEGRSNGQLSTTDMDESCQIWISYVTYEWVMSHMNESCHVWMSLVTYEWVMSHIHESCRMCVLHVTHEWVLSQTSVLLVGND